MEHRLAPVLRLVVGVSLGGEVVGLDQVLRERHHAQRLGEGLHRVDGERPHLLLLADLQKALLLGVADVAERAHREVHLRLLPLADPLVDLGGGRRRSGSTVCWSRFLFRSRTSLQRSRVELLVILRPSSSAPDSAPSRGVFVSTSAHRLLALRIAELQDLLQGDPDVRDVLLDVGALLPFLVLAPAPTDVEREPAPALLQAPGGSPS